MAGLFFFTGSGMEAAIKLVVFWTFVLAGYVEAQVNFLYDSGNPSSSLKDFTLTGNAKVEADGIHLEYSSIIQTVVLYHKSVASNIPLSFSSSVTFSLMPESAIYFQVVGLSYNFPYCLKASIAPELYNCTALSIAFDSFTPGQVGLSLFMFRDPSPRVTSSFKRNGNQTLTTWIDYHTRKHPKSVRVWMAEGNSSSKTPVIHFEIALPGSYFFPSIVAALPGTSSVIKSWSFSSFAPSTA